MTLLGKGVLAIWNGIAEDSEDEFLNWHVHEHIRERVILPGFLRARRYVSIDGNPRYFNFYETAAVSDLSSEAYRAALNRPTPWTEKVVRHFTETSRTVCEVSRSDGCGEGVAVETIRLSSNLDPDQFAVRMTREVIAETAARHTVVGAHLLRGKSSPQKSETAETKLRGGVDEVAEWVLLVETVRAETIFDIRLDLISDEQLIACGASPGFRRGAYALQYSLGKAELDGGIQLEGTAS